MEYIRKMFGLDKKKLSAKVKTVKREHVESASSSARKATKPVQKRKDMEYSGEIYKYLRRVERVFAPRCSFLDDKEQFRRGDRQKAIEWMLDVTLTFEFKRETLYSGVSLFDRYVELVQPKKEEYGLLCLTCLYVAYKYEEVAYMFREVIALRTFQGKTHETSEIYEKELEILTSLGWRLSHVGPMSFFDVLAIGCPLSTEAYDISQKITECLLLSGFSTRHQSSLLGASIFWIALKIDGRQEWNLEFSAKSLYTEPSIKETALEIVTFLKEEKLTNEKLFSFGITSYKIENILTTLKPFNIEKRINFLEESKK